MPGSILPLRVPIIKPSSGVKPMEVSTQRPWCTADTEAPLPRWAMIRRTSWWPSISAARVVLQRQLLACLWLARIVDNQPGRCRRPVDAPLHPQQLTFYHQEAEFQTAGTGVTDESFHRCLPQGRGPARARVVPLSATPQPSAAHSLATPERWSAAGSRATAQTPPVQRLLE